MLGVPGHLPPLGEGQRAVEDASPYGERGTPARVVILRLRLRLREAMADGDLIQRFAPPVRLAGKTLAGG